MIAIQDPFGQLPPAAGTFSEQVDPLFNFLMWISIFFFALILGILAYSALRYRRKTADQPAATNTTHHTMLEVVWTLIPTIILMVTFAWGLKGNLDQQIVPADARGYRAVASKWAWDFYHPGDDVSNPLSKAANVYAEVGKPIRVTMTSLDVLHSLYVPAMRAKRDIVPGVRQIMWFTPTVEGEFDLYCTEYCGDGHSEMRRKLHVVDAETYAERPWAVLPETPEERGKLWYDNNCATCHNLDDQKKVGPGWAGIWEREGRLVDGSSYVADRDYIYESIRNPNAKMVAGYAGGMTQYTEALLTDEQIDDIIAFMKTLD